jgi:phosphoglycolate phosphatase
VKQIFFDLDGTLTDPRDGIVACIRHAMAALGRNLPATENLDHFIGPPLSRTFRILLDAADHETIERAIAAYRERFETVGIFENRVFAGVPEALAALVQAGHQLHLVTVKPIPFATRILQRFDLAAHFVSVHAPDLGARDVQKGFLIREALEAIRVDPASVTMVGDRGEDVDGARQNGVRSIAVTWGYGSRLELEAAQPDHLINSVTELLGVLGAV